MKKEYKKKWETQLKMNLLIGWVQSFIWNLQDKKNQTFKFTYFDYSKLISC